MSLKKRIIPIVLIDGFSVVKTIQFNERRNLGSPITVARTYNTRNVDELILLDIDASLSGRPIDIYTIKDIARQCFMPLTVGGGLRTIADIEAAILAGADKVSLNEETIKSPKILNNAARIFGSQSIVASMDVTQRNGRWQIYSKISDIDLDALEWLKQLEDNGAGEILVNVVEKDGMMLGPAAEFAEEIANASRVPIIYAGGVSSVEDCITLGKLPLAGLAISSIFHFTSLTPLDCKLAMAEAGIDVRLN